jgi:formamidopyrimidine-DNA glycosylase
MPELPDITIYIEALGKKILGQRLENLRIVSPFLLRSVEPPVASAIGKSVAELRRLGKRICIGLRENGSKEGENAGHSSEGRFQKAGPTIGLAEDIIWLVLHLMIAGRLHWGAKGKKLSRQHLAAFDFANGSLLWTEAGSEKRASLHLAQGEAGLAELDPGGLEVFSMTKEEFARTLRSENHTLKRALTDPEWFSGIGNAYSDEILWQAKLSPLAQTLKLKDEEIARLFDATRESLTQWTERLRREAGEKFPEGVTAFRPEMAVHGKYKQDCPRCGGKVQRIKYASNETNYCPTCQTGGKLLADRAFSRLLREDWPRTPEELEMKMRRGISTKA